jgi:hypothetical protein
MGITRPINHTMSASKKSTSKTSKSPAPATKTAAPAKPARAAATVAPAKPAVKKKATASVAVAPTKIAAVTVKPVARQPVLTTIGARIDIGFGNVLSIRGEGAGLSWDQGLVMDCVEADLWRVTLPESAHGHTFKFLVNDLTWSTGPDYTVPSGAHVTLTPEF